jgi:hypothetical protein
MPLWEFLIQFFSKCDRCLNREVSNTKKIWNFALRSLLMQILISHNKGRISENSILKQDVNEKFIVTGDEVNAG